MFHFFEAITNTSGDSLIGYFGRVISTTSLLVVPIFADESGTPIAVTSGVTNAATTDESGNLDFYVTPGTYHLDLYAPDGTTFIKRVQNVAMNSTKGDQGDPGPQGPEGEGLAEVMAPTGAALVGITITEPNSVPENVLSKVARQVDVWDFMTAEMKADVVAGQLSVNCSPAFQKAFDACSGKTKSSLTTGRKLHIPAGRYRLDDPVTWTWRADNAVPDAGDRRKLTVEGDGAANTILFSTVTSGFLFTVRGYATGGGAQDGTHLDLTMRGITTIHNNSRVGGGRVGGGWAINKISRVHLFDFASQYFNVGADLFDAINVKIDFCDFQGNNLGLRGGNNGFSNPNLWRVTSTAFGGCQVKGVELSRAANASFDTCGFEGIGTSHAPDSGFYAAHLLGGPTEGGASVSFVNCYFEGNDVAADIRPEWGDSNNGTIKVDMCSFNRVSNTQYARRHMLPSQVGAGRLNVLFDGNVYKHLGTYAGSEPPWEIPTANVIAYSRGEEYAETARPAPNGFATVGLLINVMSAAVALDGTYDSTSEHTNNVASITKTGTGAYRVFYKNNPRDFANVHPNITLANSSGFGTYSTRASDHIDIVTLDAAGNAADKGFTLNVFGGF